MFDFDARDCVNSREEMVQKIDPGDGLMEAK